MKGQLFGLLLGKMNSAIDVLTDRSRRQIEYQYPGIEVTRNVNSSSFGGVTDLRTPRLFLAGSEEVGSHRRIEQFGQRKLTDEVGIEIGGARIMSGIEQIFCGIDAQKCRTR